MPENPQPFPFGLWPSPITAGQAAKRLRLEDVLWSADGQTLFWLEGRPGGAVLTAQTGLEAPQDLTETHIPRGGVGYGGGAFTAGEIGGQTSAVFAERDGRLYKVGINYDRPQAITPALGSAAAPALSPDGRWAAFVYTNGSLDLLALAPTDGIAWPVQISRGADFYMQPAWHPAGEWLAWVEWDHPNMPWDGTRLQLARVAASPNGGPPHLVDVRTVAGGEDTPVAQPAFSPDGRWLSFIEETGEWPNLVALELTSGQRRILVEGNGFELSLPAWVQGGRSYGWTRSANAIYHLRYQGPYATLWRVDLDSGQSTPIELAPYTWLTQLSVSPARDVLALIASAPHIPDRLIVWDAARPEHIRVAARSGAESIAPASLSQPRPISWQSPDGSPVYALYYPPANPCCTGEGLPPAVVNVHGGPTSIAGARFNAEAVYFTTRGYAWVELNYRGSTGYGRSYRRAMRRRWGQVDVEDAAGCAQALSAQGLADSARLAISGGSAGGYTVLNTLIHYPGLYKAGICRYGVANLFTLDLDTHKFEKHYNATLIGPLPQAAPQYRAWSPVFHAERIQDPVYIFQGSDDRVVPPAQSEEVVAVLRQKGIPHRYKLYEGEGHGFRRPETIADFLQEMEKFLQHYVLFV